MQPDTSQLYLYIRVIDYELQGIPHFISFLVLVKPLENQCFCFNRSLDFVFLVIFFFPILYYYYTKEGNYITTHLPHLL